MPFYHQIKAVCTHGWAKLDLPRGHSHVQLSDGSKVVVKDSEVAAFIKAEQTKLEEKKLRLEKKRAEIQEAIQAKKRAAEESANNSASDNAVSQTNNEPASQSAGTNKRVRDDSESDDDTQPSRTIKRQASRSTIAAASRPSSTASRTPSRVASVIASRAASRAASRSSSSAMSRGGGFKKPRSKYEYMSTDDEDSDAGYPGKKTETTDDEYGRKPHVTEAFTDMQKERKTEVLNARQAKLAEARAAAEKRDARRKEMNN